MNTMKGMLLVTALCATVAVAAAGQDRLPEGEGKIQVETSCTTRCHQAAQILRARRTPTEWETIIDVMIQRGAEISDSEYDVILEYLSQYLLATVNVNTEGANRIAVVLEISDAEAAAIVQCREKQGPFKRWEDVAKAPGVDAKIIEERKARLAFE